MLFLLNSNYTLLRGNLRAPVTSGTFAMIDTAHPLFDLRNRPGTKREDYTNLMRRAELMYHQVVSR
jgi:hypothetical protein